MIMSTAQRKGDIATPQAVAKFTKMGFDTSIPLTESVPHDLVVDGGKKLNRVQVKYTSTKEIGLRNIHSNSGGGFN